MDNWKWAMGNCRQNYELRDTIYELGDDGGNCQSAT